MERSQGHDHGSYCARPGHYRRFNWGSIGLFRFDLVAWLFGGQTATVSRVIYTLVGLAALWCISLLFRSDAITDDEI